MTDTVTVACKLPNGLMIHVDQMVDGHEPSPQGFLSVKKAARHEKYPEPVRLNGFRRPRGEEEAEDQRVIVGGYGLTPGVDAEFFNLWLEQNKDSELVKNRIVFAYPKTADARAAAKEHAKSKSGLEPFIPPKLEGGRSIPQDPRHPRSINPNLSTVGTADPNDRD